MDDVVITMLADDAAVESVAFGDHGVIGSLGKGAIHVSTSTISVALSERLTAAHAKAGPRFVAAPVFGRPDVAAAGQLFIVAAGAREAMALVGKAGIDRHRYLGLLTSTLFPAPAYPRSHSWPRRTPLTAQGNEHAAPDPRALRVGCRGVAEPDQGRVDVPHPTH